jgi:hypothetical protein
MRPVSALPALAALALVLVSQASPASRSGALSKGPPGLRAFLLRAGKRIAILR